MGCVASIYRCWHIWSCKLISWGKMQQVPYGSVDRDKPLIRVPFTRLAVITVFLPLLGLVACIVLALLYHYNDATYTHCEVSENHTVTARFTSPLGIILSHCNIIPPKTCVCVCNIYTHTYGCNHFRHFQNCWNRDGNTNFKYIVSIFVATVLGVPFSVLKKGLSQ